MRRTSVVVVAVAVAIGVAFSAGAGGAGAASSVYVSFRTPSGNIGCGYSKFAGESANLRCEIVSRLRPLPPRPRTCTDGVWGRAVGMSPTGRASGYCITDTVMDPGAPVLGYGTTWSRGGFRCASRVTGLTCTNLAGHGWFLSRERSRIF